MGEVRVKTKLTNAVDQALVRRGLMKPDQVRVYEADALVDTGAVRCVLPPYVVERLGLNSIGMRTAEYADGRLGSVPLTEPFVLETEGRAEMENALVLGDEVLIGQTAFYRQNARKLANLVYDLTDNGALAQGTAAGRTKFAGLPCP